MIHPGVVRFAKTLPTSFIAGKLPLVFAFLLEALIAFSLVHTHLLSPAVPQVAGNQGYRQLWLGNVDGPGGAVHLFEQALQSDPAFPYRWSDLGEALLMARQPDRARYSFQRAVELAPHDPQIRLRAANFYFRNQEIEPALQMDSTVLQQLPDYDPMIFSSYVRMGGDIPRVLELGIGSNARAARAFFNFLAPQSDANTSGAVWNWMEERGFVTVPMALARTSWLLEKSLPAEATAVWLRYATPAGSPYRKTDWIFNSGFENQWTGEGFDWRVDPCTGVAVVADERIAHSGRRSLRIEFHAAENLDFHHVSQMVWLSPGRYRLRAWMRTQDLSTDEGVGLNILDVNTAALTGTHDWTELASEFSVRGAPQIARVQIVRRPSARFDSRPQGTVWIDDVELKRLP